MKTTELKKLAEEIAELEIELQRDPSPSRKMQVEREIVFRSENPDLELTDYFILDEMIQSIVEKRLHK